MNKNLLFGKAIGAALLFVMMSLANSGIAQTQVATLQHGEDFSAFYGVNAFIEAHEAAVDGDVITLSSGNFNSTDITKAITLHGAGIYNENLTNITPTYLSGNVNINILNEDLFLYVEGIYFHNWIYVIGILNHARFTKCRFDYINATGEYGMDDVEFNNCYMISEHWIRSVNYNVRFNNCIIDNLLAGGTSIHMYNCIVFCHDVNHLYAYNSIIWKWTSPSDNCYFYNCIGINSGAFGAGHTSNCITSTFEEVFNIFNGDFASHPYYMDYTLTDAIISNFQGNDGSQVGVFGGAMPYNPRPSYLILNNTTVAGQSDVNGNLNVNIEIIEENK